MPIYVVAYDVKDEARADAIRARLQELEAKDRAVHVQKSVWLVRAKGPVASHLHQYLDEDEDALLVSRIRARDDLVVWGDGGESPSFVVEQFLDDGGF